jgi:hypothetical protein
MIQAINGRESLDLSYTELGWAAINIFLPWSRTDMAFGLSPTQLLSSRILELELSQLTDLGYNFASWSESS